MTTRIPKTAWPVVEEIRKHVPKPAELPTPEENLSTGLTWECESEFGPVRKCPLGLLPYALAVQPNHELDFDSYCPFDLSQAEVFWLWWDVQFDAEEAVAEVWEEALSE